MHVHSFSMFTSPQEKAAKWKNPDGQMDGLTTNGVLVMHPRGGFTEESKPGVWREISVCGDVYTLRETRSAQTRGKLVSGTKHLFHTLGPEVLWYVQPKRGESVRTTLGLFIFYVSQCVSAMSSGMTGGGIGIKLQSGQLYDNEL